jgi:predicted unusual protein kinase regulating ubiquinone biosynthesis (AarF/ABC1/UbiB family)
MLLRFGRFGAHRAAVLARAERPPRGAAGAAAAFTAAAAAAAGAAAVISPSGCLLVSHALRVSPFTSTVAHTEAAAPVYSTESFGLPGSVEVEDDTASLLTRAFVALKLATRVVYLSGLGISVLLPGLFVRFLDQHGLSPGPITELWWAWAVQALEIAGPTFIKLAQWAASRPDMFPGTFCERFGVLHDSTTPHAWKHTAVFLDTALGPEWDQRLVLDPEVIGSGCIAQVYSGTWYATPAEAESGKGTKVAIKVSHPNIYNKVNADMKILKYLARQVEYWIPEMEWMGGLDVITDFEALMHRQMDLRVEARNLNRFRENFAQEPGMNVDFPRPIFTTESVLVETFAEGRPINEFINGDYSPKVKKIIADAGVQVSLKMVFKHNFIHADLHPGNILIDWDGDEDSIPRIVCLDAGLAYQVHTIELRRLTCFIKRLRPSFTVTEW